MIVSKTTGRSDEEREPASEREAVDAGDGVADSRHPARWWHATADGRIQCDLCPRDCKLHDGQRGMCFVRRRVGDAMELTTYGRSSGFCVDPIEKKPLNHFYPGSSVLSFGTAGCNLACSFCFHPDTLVATPSGMRRIEDLYAACRETTRHDGGEVGFPDALEVLTRGAQSARVTKVFAHPYDGELISLKAACCPPVVLTPNHKVFAVHRSAPDRAHKVRADALTRDHFLVVPKRRAGGRSIRLETREVLSRRAQMTFAARPRRTPFSQLTHLLRSEGDSEEVAVVLGYHPAYVRKLRGQLARGVLAEVAEEPAIEITVTGGRTRYSRERGPGIPERVELSMELAWLLGVYCAEGSVCELADRPNSCRLAFSCGHHEQDLVARIARLLTEIFGARVAITTRPTTLTAECSSASLARFFESLCGKGAKHKRVPVEIAQSSEAVIRAFLDGYLAGDGHSTDRHVVGNTVSAELALGLYELGLHLDLLPSHFVFEPPPTTRIEGREVSQATTYIVKFSRTRYERRARREYAIWRDAGTHFLVPVRAVERVPYTGRVYNLEVDDPDHSYLAPFLAVSNCQNWSISKSRDMDRIADAAGPEDIARAALGAGCTSVAFTYNDPTIFAEYAMDVADACHAVGLKTVAVTAGYIHPAPRREFYAKMDAANVDLKAFTEEFYHKRTASRLAPVLDTLRYLVKETDVWTEITTLLIPGLNDSDDELARLSDWVARELGVHVPLHFSAFHPDYKLADVPPTPPATLRRARRIARAAGLLHVYTGNVHDREGDTTHCAQCGEAVIERDWYELLAYRLDARGRCAKCGAPAAGKFGEAPGAFGRRRMRLAIATTGR